MLKPQLTPQNTKQFMLNLFSLLPLIYPGSQQQLLPTFKCNVIVGSISVVFETIRLKLYNILILRWPEVTAPDS